MRLPWVSREMHEAVSHEKDRLIVALQNQINALEKRLMQPVPVTVQLPEDFAVLQPAVVLNRKKSAPVAASPEQPAPVAIDWANVDPDDNLAIAQIVAQETGGAQINAYGLARIVRQIKSQIRTARIQKAIRQHTPAEIPAPASVEVEKPEVATSEVPAHIKRIIEAAERGE